MEKEKKQVDVVLVDDDEFLLDMYAIKFKERGVLVHAFQEPTAALEYLRAGNSTDLLITDVVMPGMNGFDFLRAVQELHLSRPPHIIMLTNQGQGEDVDKANQFGVIGYIIKANAIPSEVVTQCLELYQKNVT